MAKAISIKIRAEFSIEAVLDVQMNAVVTPLIVIRSRESRLVFHASDVNAR